MCIGGTLFMITRFLSRTRLSKDRWDWTCLQWTHSWWQISTRFTCMTLRPTRGWDRCRFHFWKQRLGNQIKLLQLENQLMIAMSRVSVVKISLWNSKNQTNCLFSKGELLRVMKGGINLSKSTGSGLKIFLFLIRSALSSILKLCLQGKQNIPLWYSWSKIESWSWISQNQSKIVLRRYTTSKCH